MLLALVSRARVAGTVLPAAQGHRFQVRTVGVTKVYEYIKQSNVTMLLNHESSLFKNVNGPLLMPHVMVYSTPLSPYARAPAQDRVDSDERASLV